jgi:hypothetical protein
MNKRSAAGVKITPSVNNLIFLFLLAFSIFIIYRYVKSLEKELTLLKAELSKVKAATPPPPKEEQVCVGDVCMMVTAPSNEKEDGTEDEEDMESVTSKDILKIVDQINGEEDDADDDADEPEVQLEEPSTTPSTTASANVPPLPIPPPVTQAESPQPEETENEDIIIKKTTNSYEEDLYKKTNEELKKILKDQGKNTKGAKAELIKRIIEEL